MTPAGGGMRLGPNFLAVAARWLHARRGSYKGTPNCTDCEHGWNWLRSDPRLNTSASIPNAAQCKEGHALPEGEWRVGRSNGHVVRVFHASSREDPPGTHGYGHFRYLGHCKQLIERALAGEDVPPDAAEAVRFDGPAMREEAQRVLRARLPDSMTAEWERWNKAGNKGRPLAATSVYTVTSVLWYGHVAHTAEDSWMAVLDDGRVGLVARRPKVPDTRPCRTCDGMGRTDRMVDGRYRPHLRMPCRRCDETGRRIVMVYPKPSRIVGIFPDFASAAAALPDAYWQGEEGEEALRRAQRQWDARARGAVAVEPVGGGVEGRELGEAHRRAGEAGR